MPLTSPSSPVKSGVFTRYIPAASGTDKLVRLNKRLADMGLCSRREADHWIARGWVLVNGQVGQTGQKVQVNDTVSVQKNASACQARQITVLLHKPIGVVSTQPEDGKVQALQLIRASNQWQQDRSGLHLSSGYLPGLAAAGRLDIDSTGLLVLTQDGRIARTLIGNDSAIEKEYLVRVALAQTAVHDPHEKTVHNVQEAFAPHKLALLRHGLVLDGKPLKPAQVVWQNPQQLRFVLQEGKKRQIRRMCEQVGLHVLGLKRVRIGKVMLGALPPGQWRFLHSHESFD